MRFFIATNASVLERRGPSFNSEALEPRSVAFSDAMAYSNGDKGEVTIFFSIELVILLSLEAIDLNQLLFF